MNCKTCAKWGEYNPPNEVKSSNPWGVCLKISIGTETAKLDGKKTLDQSPILWTKGDFGCSLYEEKA